MKIAILFSGGIDSTSLADKIHEQYSEIHLLTHVVPLSAFNKFALKNANVLKSKYPEKIRHEFIDSKQAIDRVRGNIFNVLSDNSKFRFYYSWCLGCKIGMHLQTIKYCVKNKIDHVADGNNLLQVSHALEQSEDFVNEMKTIYKKYGITYSCPLYNEYKIENTEKDGFFRSVLKKSELINYRVKEEIDFVNKGFIRGMTIGQQHRSIQPQCFFALLLNLTRLSLSFVKEENKTAHVDYLRSKTGIMDKLINS